MKKNLSPLEKEIKQTKNDISASLKKIQGVNSPVGLTKYLVETKLSEKLYDKTFEEIKIDMEETSEVRFNGTNIIEYMNSTNQRAILVALKQIAQYINSKEGIDYSKVSSAIFDDVFFVASDSHEHLQRIINDGGKKESVYNYLKRTTKDEYTLAKAYEEQKEDAQFDEEQEKFLEETRSWETHRR